MREKPAGHFTGFERLVKSISVDVITGDPGRQRILTRQENFLLNHSKEMDHPADLSNGAPGRLTHEETW
jgi:hypothetical protein